MCQAMVCYSTIVYCSSVCVAGCVVLRAAVCALFSNICCCCCCRFEPQAGRKGGEGRCVCC